MVDKKYIIENEIIFEEITYGTFSNKILIGGATKTETIRIDDNTVADVTYQFIISEDGTVGDYVEQSRVERAEPLPPVPESTEQKIASLEADNSSLKSQNADIIFALVSNNLM